MYVLQTLCCMSAPISCVFAFACLCVLHSFIFAFFVVVCHCCHGYCSMYASAVNLMEDNVAHEVDDL